MKNHILVICIILCSLLSWLAGAYILDTYLSPTSPKKEVHSVVTEEASQKTAESVISMTSLEDTVIETVRDISPSVVSIIIKKDLIIYRSDPFGFFTQPQGTIKRQVGGGTGFFIRKDGTIITNKHVVSDRNAIYTVITNSGEEYDAIVLATDPLSDLAIIKIDSFSEFPPLNVISSTQDISIGQFAIAIWNALAEFQNSVSLWIVSGKERSISAWDTILSGLIQTDTAINPGNSWWPLINLNGEVMGINTAIINDSQGIGFSIALTQSRIEYMLESIAASGDIKRPFIGINYIPNSPWVQQELWLGVDYGAYIIDEAESVVNGSSAQKAGLEPWDIILQIDNQDITLKNNLGSIIQNKIPGDTLQIQVLKKSGDTKELELQLGAY